jgi:hypothetical protein
MTFLGLVSETNFSLQKVSHIQPLRDPQKNRFPCIYFYSLNGESTIDEARGVSTTGGFGKRAAT